MVFKTTLECMAFLFSLIVIGYILVKCKALPEEASIPLSKLENFLFIPALVMGAFMNNFTIQTLGKMGIAFLGGTVFLLVSIPIAIFFAKILTKDKTSENGYKYHLAVDGVQSGDAIDIKDMVVSGGSVAVRDGKTYLDLTIANGETVSIPADSLVDTYKAAEGEDRIVVNGYTISLDQAKLVEDLVADSTMLGKFATVENLGKANDAVSELTTKHNEFETAVANTYATKDEAIGTLTELTFTGAVDSNSYSASFSAKDVKGTVHSTVTFDLATKTEIESLF